REKRACACWPAADGGLGPATIGMAVVREEVDGRRYFSLADGVSVPGSDGRPNDAADGRSPPLVDLVQCYDEVLLGYTESRDVLAPSDRLATVLRAHWHAILVDGCAVGHWRYAAGRDGVEVETDLWAKLAHDGQRSPTNAVD